MNKNNLQDWLFWSKLHVLDTLFYIFASGSSCKLASSGKTERDLCFSDKISQTRAVRLLVYLHQLNCHTQAQSLKSQQRNLLLLWTSWKQTPPPCKAAKLRETRWTTSSKVTFFWAPRLRKPRWWLSTKQFAPDSVDGSLFYLETKKLELGHYQYYWWSLLSASHWKQHLKRRGKDVKLVKASFPISVKPLETQIEDQFQSPCWVYCSCEKVAFRRQKNEISKY